MSKYDDTKFYWLQLKEDFFDEGAIDWLEDQPNGKGYSLFYLKLCLKSLKTNGVLIRRVGDMLVPYDHIKLGELTKTSPDTVLVAMELLKKIGLVQICDNGELYLTQVANMVCSQSKGAFLKQQQRTKNSLGGQTADKCPPELRDRDRIKSLDKRENNIREKKNTHTFIKPTVEEVRAYCSERGNGIDAQRFVDYYTANGWKVGKNPMKDWKAAVRTWERGNGNTAKTYTSAELNAMTDNLTYDDL